MKTMLVLFCMALIARQAVALAVNDLAPDFNAPSTSGETIRLSGLKGSWVVLYFYPKAFTPGCTKESCSLRDGYAYVQKQGAKILGVSLDDIETQTRFKKEYALPFDLISDSKKEISKAYGTLGAMAAYSERKTFIISPDGKIAHIFDKVNVDDHDAEVVAMLEKLKAGK
ncbi:MAG: peroxiredoxin [Acidobacteriota bacterium]